MDPDKSFLERLDVRDMREPAEEIAKRHGCTVAELGKGRSAHMMAARRELARLLVARFGWSACAIGTFFGVHSSTALNLLRPRVRPRVRRAEGRAVS